MQQNFERLETKPQRFRVGITPEQVPALAEAYEKGISLSLVFSLPRAYPWDAPRIDVYGAKYVGFDMRAERILFVYK